MVTDHLRKLIAQAAGVSVDQVKLEHPELEDHGDYSTNIALLLKGGHKLAEEIASKLEGEDFEVSVAGPGFINFKLSPQYLTKQLDLIIKQSDKFGANDAGKDETILVE